MRGPGRGIAARRRMALGLGAGALCALALGVALAGAKVIAQKDGVRVAVDGKMVPHALPRSGSAPVQVSVSGAISAVGNAELPQLKGLSIEINRHGRLRYEGLAVCRMDQIQPATSAKALAACRGALVGQGTFSADVSLGGTEPYPSKGRLLVFNGREGSRHVLLGQIYSAQPFTNSFVIVFKVKAIRHGTYGTALVASLPRTLGSWGYVTGIEMTLRRGFVSAGCPAPKGLSRVSFDLARASFTFAAKKTLTSTLPRSCKVAG